MCLTFASERRPRSTLPPLYSKCFECNDKNALFRIQWQPTITKWSSLLMLNKQAKFKIFCTSSVDVLPTTEELIKFANDYMEPDGIMKINGVRSEELRNKFAITFPNIILYY